MDQKDIKKIKINHENFVKENTGNIKEFYKISSCIGRGKVNKLMIFSGVLNTIAEKIHIFSLRVQFYGYISLGTNRINLNYFYFRRIRWGQKMLAQAVFVNEGSQNYQ